MFRFFAIFSTVAVTYYLGAHVVPEYGMRQFHIGGFSIVWLIPAMVFVFIMSLRLHMQKG